MNKPNDDYDLWNYAQGLLPILGDIDVKIEWMPSHLRESGHEQKKKKYLGRGGTLAAIKGNDGADDLAKKGAALHHTKGIPLPCRGTDGLDQDHSEHDGRDMDG